MTGTYATATLPALLVLGFFVAFANWIPQTRWQPPERRELGAEMSPRALAEVGARIVRERGCLTCHTIEPGVGVEGQGRGPNLSGVAARRADGVPAGPGNRIDYLAEALYEPGAHLVEGYADIMPPATAAPSKLTYEEVVAVIAYLESLGGAPSARIGDVPRPSGRAAEPAAASTVAAPAESGSDEPAALLARLQCLACHSLEPGERRLGPPLDGATLAAAAAERGMSPEAYLLEAIVAPGTFVRGDFPAGVMPADYGERLKAAELYKIIDHLLSREGGP